MEPPAVVVTHADERTRSADPAKQQRRPEELRVERLLEELPSHPSVACLLRHLNAGYVVRAIDPRDEMLEFSWRDGGDWDAALLEYFSSGCRVAETVLSTAEQWFDGIDNVHGLLDFGGGYGRVTRWFAERLGAERVATSDILPGAVEFAREHLGVDAFLSAADPEDLVCSESFDLVYVGSLFTHLPEETFDSWLRCLLGLLAPGGLLVFSVHGRELVPPELDWPEDGFLFRASSESWEIDHQQYGSTWVSEQAIQQRLASVGALGRVVSRGLCGYQDLVIASLDDHSDEIEQCLASLRVEPGPRFHPERAELRSANRTGGVSARLELDVSGWAIPGADDEIVSAVRALLWEPGSRGFVPVGECAEFGLRPELLEPLGLSEGTRCGFELSAELPIPLHRSQAILMIEAVTVSSEASGAAGDRPPNDTTIVWIGGLDRLLHATALQNYVRHRQRVYELAEIIEAMKRSVFWRMRSRWFRIKRALGLTQEDPQGPPITATDRRPDESPDPR